MNITTESELRIITELKAAGWQRTEAGVMTGSAFCWRDPRDKSLQTMFGALRVKREREEEGK